MPKIPANTTSNRRKRLTPYQRWTLAYKQRYRCCNCRKLLPPYFHVDHIVPVHKNGSSELKNLQCLCVSCHAEKTHVETLNLISDEKEFCINKIIKHCKKYGHYQFWVEWEDHDKTWEGIDTLCHLELFKNYIRKQKILNSTVNNSNLDFYPIKKIIKHKKYKGNLLFKVMWDSDLENDFTWENEDNVKYTDDYKEYIKRNKLK